EPLRQVGGPLLATVSTYLNEGRSLEATARQLYVHPNTVRYRLRRIATVTGWDPLDAREGVVLQIAIAVGQLASTVALYETDHRFETTWCDTLCPAAASRRKGT